jgi:arylsulfatase A-like enzyme
MYPIFSSCGDSPRAWFTRISRLVQLGFFALFCSCLCQAVPARAAANSAVKPNIIFLLIDDMGYADLTCFGGKPGETPHIDSLAREGIRFSQFYVASPICSPSRTGFLTGQCPSRWRITSFLASREENRKRNMAQWLDVSAPMVARTLKQAGYATGHFGKWHMGGQRDVGEAPLITEYGFDESLTQFEGLGDRILPLLDKFNGEPPKKYALGSDNLGRGNIEWMDRSKVTSAFVKRAIDFMKRAEKENKPFYVNIWPDDVHSPFFPPKALRTDEAKRELYLAVVKAMDEQVAALFQFVRQDPVLRTNTILLVASDNGPEPGAGSAGPFRGHKGTLYEGGVREPLIVWAPGFINQAARGTLNDKTVVSGLDFLPSIAHLAGAELPKGVSFDGEDLSQELLGNSKDKRSKALFWTRPPERPGTKNKPLPDLAMRDGDWKLYLMRDGSNAQLFDLAQDIGETHNVADQHPEIVRRLSPVLLSWWQKQPAAGAQAKR